MDWLSTLPGMTIKSVVWHPWLLKYLQLLIKGGISRSGLFRLATIGLPGEGKTMTFSLLANNGIPDDIFFDS
jgi:hypothetical protein